ncbi:uncharacterized protein DEA37_0003891 [Paragonimus westermani]|uniref:Uncharacterized protein n=1 Tax=Paragonimus westermani TaxID=34504 RepID=A0A5J4NSX5_9TREM|nr:uncharacterized protein DEA37_0003891 [Paragonimus westermani]
MISTGIFNYLKHTKDPSTVKQLKQYLKFSAKLAEARTTVQFLSECIDKNEYPSTYWKSLRRNRIQPTSKSLKRYARNEQETYTSRLAEFERSQDKRYHMVQNLPELERNTFESYVQKIVERSAERKRTNLLLRVSPKKPRMQFPEQPERYVHNFSSLTLSKTLTEILSLGPKFCYPGDKCRQIDLEVQFENFNNQLQELCPSSELNSEHFKSTLVNACYKYLGRRTSTYGLLTRSHFEELTALKNDRSIMISRPDKGAGIVLLNRDDYIPKMMIILSDSKNFQKDKSGKDKTVAIEKESLRTLRRLKQADCISAHVFERIRPTGTRIPRLYGLPKIHKDEVPLRLILDMCNSPYHAVAQWLVEILELVKREVNKYSLRDTFEFVDSTCRTRK